jgi:hypothetical protein
MENGAGLTSRVPCGSKSFQQREVVIRRFLGRDMLGAKFQTVGIGFMYRWSRFAACVLVCCVGVRVWGQANACTVAAPDVSSTAPNIFTDRQEQDLADAMAEFFESEMRVATPGPDDQLTRIGERLVATLPATGLHYQFRIYDSGEINGFSIGGGRVYISRKLLAAVQSEDELAGVLAHEIGHIATHQVAIDLTRVFQKMGVTQVGDRTDIFARVHQMMSNPPKGAGDDRHEEAEQLAADRVAIYTMVRAGYVPESFPRFLDRMSENHGKTGNWFSNTFGLTKEETKRYAQATALIGTLPASCKGRRAPGNEAFQAWLKTAVEERIADVAAGLTEEKAQKLDPPLRPTFWRLRFSPDGKMLLGQDDGSIVIVDRESGTLRFRVDAPNAEDAQFTPDSKEVVFHDSNLRVERWDAATGKRTGVKEVVVFSGCRQTLLSPDGRTLACITLSEEETAFRVGIKIVDVASGATLFENPKFYEPSYYGVGGQLEALNILEGANVVDVAISQDGHYGLFCAVSSAVGFDFEKQQAVRLGSKLKEIPKIRMTFVGPDHLAILGERKKNNRNALHVVTFPDGQPVKEAEIGDEQFAGSSKTDSVVVWPLRDYAVGIFDLDTGKITAGSKLNAIDAWGPYTLAEDASGGFDILQQGIEKAARIPVGAGPLPPVVRGDFSRDGKFLAISLKNRAAVWNLETGKQVGVIRPFRSAWLDDKDNLVGQFPKFVTMEAQELKLGLEPLHATELAKLDAATWQYRDLEMRLKPIGKDKSTASHATLEVKKMEGQAVAWSRDFNAERPACWMAEDNRLLFAWDLSNKAVSDEIKAHPNLGAELARLMDRKKGLLLETVNPETGATLEQVILPEAAVSNGWADGRRAMVSGEMVLAQGERGSTAIYWLKDGSKAGEFFGHPVATDAQLHLIAAVNRENEILLVDETSGQELKRFTLDSPVRLARIVADTGRKFLVVLTADQVVHRIAVP